MKFVIGKRRKVKMLQFEMKNSVQYDSIITQENWNKKKVNAESVCKQKPLKLWYEKKLKSKKRINK